jgi:hypothetical protein
MGAWLMQFPDAMMVLAVWGLLACLILGIIAVGVFRGWVSSR